MSNPAFISHPHPIQDYAEAVEKIKAIQDCENNTPGFNPELKTLFLTTGGKTRQVILWFHGYTSGSKQFEQLAGICFQRGYNVLVPNFPHHGYKDRMTSEVSRLTVEGLISFTNAMVDLARGLGDELIVGGQSMGGVMTAWVAQERADVDMALIVAPFLGARIIPGVLTNVIPIVTRILPDILVWWDPQKKESIDGVDWGYPRYSTRSVGQILTIGLEVLKRGKQIKPAVKKIGIVINDHDEAVKNEMILRLASRWEKMGVDDLRVLQFPDELGLPHDCISIEQPGGKPEFIYEELLRMIEDY